MGPRDGRAHPNPAPDVNLGLSCLEGPLAGKPSGGTLNLGSQFRGNRSASTPKLSLNDPDLGPFQNTRLPSAQIMSNFWPSLPRPVPLRRPRPGALSGYSEGFLMGVSQNRMQNRGTLAFFWCSFEIVQEGHHQTKTGREKPVTLGLDPNGQIPLFVSFQQGATGSALILPQSKLGSMNKTPEQCFSSFMSRLAVFSRGPLCELCGFPALFFSWWFHSPIKPLLFPNNRDMPKTPRALHTKQLGQLRKVHDRPFSLSLAKRNSRNVDMTRVRFPRTRMGQPPNQNGVDSI